MENDGIILLPRSATKDEIAAMTLYAETGYISEEYRIKTLGNQMLGISLIAPPRLEDFKIK